MNHYEIILRIDPLELGATNGMLMSEVLSKYCQPHAEDQLTRLGITEYSFWKVNSIDNGVALRLRYIATCTPRQITMLALIGAEIDHLRDDEDCVIDIETGWKKGLRYDIAKLIK